MAYKTTDSDIELTEDMKILPLMDFSKCILVVGELIIEKCVYGKYPTIAKSNSFPVFQQEKEELRLSGTGNIIRNLKEMGLSVDVVALIGQNDNRATALINQLKIDTNNLVVSQSYRIKCVTKYFSDRGLCFCVDDELCTEMSDDMYKSMMKKVNSLMSSKHYAGIIISFGGLGLCSSNIIRDIISLSQDRGVTTIASLPGCNKSDIFSGIGYLVMSKTDIENFSKVKTDMSDVLKEICLKFNVENCIVLMPDEGIFLHQHGVNPQSERIEKSSVAKIVDMDGASDAVLAGIAFGVASYWPPLKTGYFVQLCVNNVIQTFGTVPISMIDIIPQKVLTTPKELRILKGVVPRDKSVVLTTGCFDMIHTGHVESLRLAKDLGDLLFIALNSDVSVQSYKGETRPIIPLQQRCKMLLAIKFVDFIVTFDERTPNWIVEILDPDIFVKGAEYTEERLRKTFPNLRKICLTPQLNSTTSIIENIKKM